MPSLAMPGADRRRRLAGEVERIGVIDPRHRIAVGQAIGNVLADVERGHRQHRREQEIVALEEHAHLVAQRIALEHLAVVVAQLLPQRALEHVGDRRIDQIALAFRGTAAAACRRRRRIRPTRCRPDRARTRARPVRPCSPSSSNRCAAASTTRSDLGVGPRIAERRAVGDLQARARPPRRRRARSGTGPATEYGIARVVAGASP